MTSTQKPTDYDCDPCDDADRSVRAVAFTANGRPVCAYCADIAERLTRALTR